jgi:hypothetical protein
MPRRPSTSYRSCASPVRGAVGCWAMAGAPANAAKVPITARCLIIGHFLPLRPADNACGKPRFPVSGYAMADSVPVVVASCSRLGSRVQHPTDKPELTDVFSAPCPARTKTCGLSLSWKPKRSLEQARTMPPGSERNEGMKQGGVLRNAAELQGISFAKRGRPAKS